mmetsp:Transcript_8113/g.27872  ORF Transcript_8113/g.27872 Transcript_8113/m.27872 type:complete len:204 (-) Transcript_8113:742-1353(-)
MTRPKTPPARRVRRAWRCRGSRENTPNRDDARSTPLQPRLAGNAPGSPTRASRSRACWRSATEDPSATARESSRSARPSSRANFCLHPRAAEAWRTPRVARRLGGRPSPVQAPTAAPRTSPTSNKGTRSRRTWRPLPMVLSLLRGQCGFPRLAPTPLSRPPPCSSATCARTPSLPGATRGDWRPSRTIRLVRTARRWTGRAVW